MDDYVAPDGRLRCGWAGNCEEELSYHDAEWGFPHADDERIFEQLSLEGFQAGLSWRTILTKRENFREAFAQFNLRRVAEFDERDVQRLLGDAGIVRHRGKIEAVMNNAKRALELQQAEGSLARYFWRFESPAGEVTEPLTLATSPTSQALSKDLKRRGWKFVGPTTVFAFMQALGLVNDHSYACVVRPTVIAARDAFAVPTEATVLRED